MAPRVRQNRNPQPTKRLPKHMRACSIFRITPPPHPPTRLAIAPIRRVVQFEKAIPNNTEVSIDAKPLMTSGAYGLSSFRSLLIHSVKVWALAKTQGNAWINLSPNTVGDRPNPIIQVQDNTADITVRARVGLCYPTEYAGPFKSDEAFCRISGTNLHAACIEVDATFI
jgi:hypothetical protein